MNAQKLIDNFSTHLKNVIANAISLATSLSHEQVEPIHLLTSICQENGAVATQILKEAKIDNKILLEFIHKQKFQTQKIKDIPELSDSSRKALEKSLMLAYEKAHNYIGTEHLLYGILKTNDKTIQTALKEFKTDFAWLENHIEVALNNASRFTQAEEVVDILEQLPELPDLPPNISSPLSQTPFLPPLPSKNSGKKNTILSQFTVELTDKQAQKQIDPVIGRKKEIERLINILCRRTKNNPILIGEPGVGKTAIVEGLAKKISQGDVPEILKRKKILSLDLTLLVSGTIYRGEFEARLKQIIDEVSGNDDYILFIDELHNIIGAGSNQGTMDAANILKPALARGLLRCIGATTYDEYKKYINNDPALERRFQSINVEEPNANDTLKIVKGIKKYYENFHNLTITNQALEEAVESSNRYIHDQFQPDKAIDLIDEASAAVKAQKKPNALEEKKYKLLSQFEKYRDEKEKAINEERLKDALGFKNKEKEITKKLSILSKQIEKQKNQSKIKVTRKDILKVLSLKIGIDTNILEKNEWDNLEQLSSKLTQKIFGQEESIHKITKTLKKRYLSQKTSNKPFASFLIAGPSGVGKTETAKALAEDLYHDKKALIRLDMSEFSEAHSVSKFLGSPAGYVGYKDRNRITDEIRKRPHSIILFDEIDKAHNDVIRLLLQILDEGELTDNQGKKVYFTQSIILLTTNLGSSLFRSAGIGFGSNDKTADVNKVVVKKLKEEISSEIIGRLDEICIFNPLQNTSIELLIKNKINDINNNLKINQNITVDFDKTILTQLTKEYFHPDTGARNIERKVQDLINDLIIDLLNNKKRKQKYELVYEKNNYKLV